MHSLLKGLLLKQIWVNPLAVTLRKHENLENTFYDKILHETVRLHCYWLFL